MALGSVAATNEAGPGSDPSEMVWVAFPARLTHGQLRLFDLPPVLCPARSLSKWIDGMPVREFAGISSDQCH
jgi:hypothetical protein